MKSKKYQAGGEVTNYDYLDAPENMREQLLEEQMDRNQKIGMDNYNETYSRLGPRETKQDKAKAKAKAEAAAKKAAAKKAAAKPMNMGGMVKYKRGGKVEKKKAGGMVKYKSGGKVRGCGIATQGVRQAQGEY